MSFKQTTIIDWKKEEILEWIKSIGLSNKWTEKMIQTITELEFTGMDLLSFKTGKELDESFGLGNSILSNRIFTEFKKIKTILSSSNKTIATLSEFRVNICSESKTLVLNKPATRNTLISDVKLWYKKQCGIFSPVSEIILTSKSATLSDNKTLEFYAINNQHHLLTVNLKKTKTNTRSRPPNNYTCYKCKVKGDHWILHCPQKKTSSSKSDEVNKKSKDENKTFARIIDEIIINQQNEIINKLKRLSEFENQNAVIANGIDQLQQTNEDFPETTSYNKRVRKNNNNNNDNTIKSPEFECPVCYEEFSHHIYQCVEGHLLCHVCRPQFSVCPTCRVSLSSNIRNRILEQILSTKNNKNNNNNNKKNKKNIYLCSLCDKTFNSINKRDEHNNICEFRKIHCPFVDCKWFDFFNTFCMHAQQIHHTSNGSKQPINSIKHKNNQKIYKFNHAIKFPCDALKRDNPDFVWPKIVTFTNGTKFFILSRFNDGHMTVFIRLITLLAANKVETESTGQYWIELRIKNKEKEKEKEKKEDQDNGFNGIPLRWPCDLYGIQLPFDYERKMKQLLSIHHSIFSKYWDQENPQSAAVLRFQFQVVLK